MLYYTIPLWHVRSLCRYNLKSFSIICVQSSAEVYQVLLPSSSPNDLLCGFESNVKHFFPLCCVVVSMSHYNHISARLSTRINVIFLFCGNCRKLLWCKDLGSRGRPRRPNPLRGKDLGNNNNTDLPRHWLITIVFVVHVVANILPMQVGFILFAVECFHRFDPHEVVVCVDLV